jgi:micrococcal nuclease
MYGRTLAYVWFGEVLFNEYIIKNGYATEYTFNNPYKYQKRFQDAEKYAQEHNLGLWEEQYSCEAKTYCTQMISCEEAQYYLNTCGLHRLDSDGDGIPCESLCQ